MASPSRKVTAGSLLVTLGIVFGDIGTSPLYVMSAVLGDSTITRELILGGLSCIFWTLTIQGTFKYVMLVLKADNHGEGGIFSLYTLIRKKSPQWTLYIAMIGCAALLADGIITPAISLTASIEGLHNLSEKIPVIPIVIAILVALFTFQQFGTEKVGRAFGPVMLIWFGMLTFWGAVALAKNPGVLEALNPYHAFHILTTHPRSWFIVGAVFLCVTGAEALYSDLGHVGRANIRWAWVFVKLALLINYFGQGAWALTALENMTLDGVNPFFALMPRWFVGVGVVIAVTASIVASQALITGSFSLINEAVKLETWFRVQTRHPSRYRGQLFIPTINHILFVGSVFVVLYFGKSANMEAAYGIAITITMLSTSVLLIFYLRQILKWHWTRVILVSSIFFCVEGVFFAGNIQKIAHGAGVTLLLMAIFLGVMLVHYQGKQLISKKRRFVDVNRYADIIRAVSEDKDIPKFASNIVYLTNAKKMNLMEKQILKSIYQKQPKRADKYWILHFNETDEPFQENYHFIEILKDKIYRVDFMLGYKVKPNVREMFTKAIAELEKKGLVNLENPYKSLHRFDVPADFLFIVMRNTFNLSSDSPIREIFLLNGYKFLQAISEPPEQYLGIDRNALLVEYIALK